MVCLADHMPQNCLNAVFHKFTWSVIEYFVPYIFLISTKLNWHLYFQPFHANVPFYLFPVWAINKRRRTLEWNRFQKSIIDVYWI